jgi:hypothetical protein
MTQDEIIDMAREAKWVGIYVPVTLEQIGLREHVTKVLLVHRIKG